ncbi:MAG: hypothetical protein OXG88_05450 [Gammaproteobacteria bacterium]|nr:hypothetical protein [Gammaproteobacteria bacterium]
MLALASLIVASTAVYWTIRSDILSKKEMNKKLENMDITITEGLDSLDHKIMGIDRNYQRLRGQLEGAQVIKYEDDDND